MAFQTTDKFLIVFVRLILGKKGINGVTGPRREIDIRYEIGLKGLGYKQRFLQPFFINFLSND